MNRFQENLIERNYSLLSKVYGLLAFSIASAVVGAFVGLSHIALISSNFLVFAILEFVMVFITSFVGSKPEMAPLGFVLLNVFTFFTGLTTAPLLAFALAVNPAAIIYALVVTGATFVVMSSLPIFFKVNLSGLGSFLFAGLIAIVIASLLNLFFHSGAVALAVSVIATVLFSIYVSYDTQRILESDPNTPALILTLALYLDILNIFVNVLFLILEFSGNRRN